MHCVGLRCPEGGVLTLSVSFLFLYKQRSQGTSGLGRAVESAPHPPGVPHSGRGLTKVKKVQVKSQ